MTLLPLFFFFFFNDTATTEIYTLSLHDALPISFVIKNKLTFSYLLNPILLRMFDGSTPTNISKKVQMLITFSTGETHHLELFITKLDENYSLVLGYDWLA